MKIEFWNKTSPLILPDGNTYTPEQIFKKFPHVRTSAAVLEYMSEDVVGAIDSLMVLRSIWQIPDGLTDSEALAEIIAKRTNPDGSNQAPPSDEYLLDMDYRISKIEMGL